LICLIYVSSFIFHINPYDLVALGTLFTGLTLALLLGFAKRVGPKGNLFLSLALVIIVLKTGGLTSILLPALGPLLYFYVWQLTSSDRKFSRKDMLHFCPLLITFWLPVWLVLISVIIYLYLSHRLIQDFYSRLQPVLMDRPRFAFRHLDKTLFLLGVVCVLSLFNGIFFFGIAFILIGMSAETMLKPDKDVQLTTPITDRSDAREKGRRLKEAVAANRLYEDAELTLATLAVKLSIHPHDLSRIMNIGLEKNFSDFINEFRVREIARKMQDPAYDRLTLLGIAYESGFNSKRTFNRVFKEMTGQTPVEYKNSLKKEGPINNLALQSHKRPLILHRDSIPQWSPVKSNRNIMLKNYFKISWRNLMRNKSYAAINITGLAIGIAACLLIFLIVQFETSFDNFHTKKDSIYRVVTASKGPNGMEFGSGVPFPTSAGLRVDYPQLKGVAAILRYGGQYSVGNANSKQAIKKFKEDDAYYCEPQFFDIFDFEWLAGDKKTALSEARTTVLTQDEADRFFGDWHNAIGKVIRYNNQTDLKVTGVLKNFPDNTDFPVKMLVSYATMREKNGDFNGNMNDWVSIFGSHYVFVVLPSSLSVPQFNKDLAAFVKKHKPAEYVKSGMQLQPLSDMHYNTKIHIFGTHVPFSKGLINAISLIGVFLLIIACVNFINLATAQAVNRSKEVGIRKVLGGNRKQLILQFLSETFIIALFAVAIAIVIAALVIPPLNKLLQISLTNAMLYQPVVISFIGATIIGVTLLSGFYPAIVLSGFNPITALKNKIIAGRARGISLRSALVVLQFGIAQVLVIGTLVIVYQMNYFRNKSLGFDKDAMMNVSFPNDSANLRKLPALRDQLMQVPGVKGVSFSYASPSDYGGWSTDFKYDNSPKKTDFNAYMKWADADYFDLYKLRFVAGQPYKKSDTINGYVVNETLLHKLGVNDPRQAIGKYINMWDDKTKYARITGVVKDFNITSLKDAIPAVMMASWRDVFHTINIKVQPAGISSTQASIQKIWDKTFPDGIYEYQFLDDKIVDFYKKDDQLSMLYKIFAGIAIFISCLGLYGLVSFMAVQRTKEVGIRKTLGASVGNIVYLFSKEFTLLIVIAFLISAPIGYYFMYQWLQDYSYKIPIGPGIFAMAMLISVTIAWASVGYKAVRAALTNPVKSLRSE